MGVAAIVSSDLPRALRTAEAIAAATGALVETSALLRERNFGDWRGQPYDALAIDPLTMPEAPPGGESAVAFERRVSRAFAHIVRRQSACDGRLAVVTHGLVIGAMLADHVRLPAGMALPGHLGNTGLSVIGARPPHAVTLINCTRHLEPAARDDAHALSGG
jgi:probable phosphoglycerate mutase